MTRFFLPVVLFIASVSAATSSQPTSLSSSTSVTPSKTTWKSSPTSDSYPCAEGCIQTYLSKTTCTIDPSREDSGCTCNDKSQVAQDLRTCVKGCPSADQEYFTKVEQAGCTPSASTSASSSAHSATTSASGIANSATSPAPTSSTTVATHNAVAPAATGSFVAMVGGFLAAVLAF